MSAEIRPLVRRHPGPAVQSRAGGGTLTRERFTFYMVQDAHYLGAFARALATAAAKATTPDAQIKLAKSAHDAIVVERALHEGFFREFGVELRPSPPPALARPAPATAISCSRRRASIRSRSRSGHSCPASRSTTRSASTSRDRRRRTPTSAGSTPTATRRSGVGARGPGADGRGARRGQRRRAGAMREAYLKAVRYEWMFWDSAYRLEAWPV